MTRWHFFLPMSYNCTMAYFWKTSKKNYLIIKIFKMSKVTIKPLADRVLIEPAAAETTTASGIIIPDSAKEKPAEGEVIAVGKGKINEKGDRVKMDVKVGDRVLFSKYGGTDVKFDGVDHLIMREDDILAVVER